MQSVVDTFQAMANDPTLYTFLAENKAAYTTLLGLALPADAVGQCFAALVGSIVFCWVAQVSSGYWSWVDRFWSVIPAVYAVIFAYHNTANTRLVIMAGLAVVWALRLTFNFARKGGYHDLEDYRWAVLRDFFKKNDPVHPVGQELFHIFFVCIYQHFLLWLLIAPVGFLVARAGFSGLTTFDYALAAGFLVLLAAETWCDEAQWRFQTHKYSLKEAERKKAGGDTARGFCTTGPFAISRHLNFFSEQSMWWVFAGFTVSSAAATWPNWTFLGAFLLTLLFQGSTQMTEILTLNKYPTYAAYQQTTSRLVPWFPGTSLDSDEGQKLVAQATAKAKKSA
jgi:steroid 5-alpha reductase family enzyme